MAVRPGETEDLASLTHLNEAILLDELKARYKKDDIYVRNELFSSMSNPRELACNMKPGIV